MTIVKSPLTNGAFWPRTMKPTVLLVVHITSNMGTAKQQRTYANRAPKPGQGPTGPSAHDYLDTDGSGIEALDPAAQCAWSNGDVQAPNLSIATVKAAVAAGVNPNRVCYREVECTGDGGHPVTDAQIAQLARFVAADSKATGLPVNRSTVTTHADWNSVQRSSCAFPPAKREARLAQIIAQANAILNPPPPAPAPAWSLHVAKGVQVHNSVLDAHGHYTVPDDLTPPFEKDSSAACGAQQEIYTTTGQRIAVVLVTQPTSGFHNRYVHLGPGVTAAQSK